MPTAKQKKLREQRETAKRRRLHGRSASVRAAGGPVSDDGRLVGDTDDIVQPAILGEFVAMQDDVVDVIPTRAKCPACGFSQKVRKDGTIGAHVVATSAEMSEARQQCEGAGKPWTSASPA